MPPAVNAQNRLRGLTEKTITVASSGSEIIILASIIGVTNFVELQDALQGTSGFTDASHDRNIIVVENDIHITGMISLPGSGAYTLVAEPGTSVSLIRDSSCTISLILVSTGDELILGSTAGLTGNIMIDGASIGLV